MKKLLLTALFLLVSNSAFSSVIRVDFTAKVNFVYSKAYPSNYRDDYTFKYTYYSNINVGDTFSSFFLIDLTRAGTDTDDNVNRVGYISGSGFVYSPLSSDDIDNSTVSKDFVGFRNETGDIYNDWVFIRDEQIGSNPDTISYSSLLLADSGSFIDSPSINQSFSLDTATLASLSFSGGSTFYSEHTDGGVENTSLGMTFDYYDYDITSFSYNVVSAPASLGLCGLMLIALGLKRRLE